MSRLHSNFLSASIQGLAGEDIHIFASVKSVKSCEIPRFVTQKVHSNHGLFKKPSGSSHLKVYMVEAREGHSHQLAIGMPRPGKVGPKPLQFQVLPSIFPWKIGKTMIYNYCICTSM